MNRNTVLAAFDDEGVCASPINFHEENPENAIKAEIPGVENSLIASWRDRHVHHLYAASQYRRNQSHPL